MAWKSVLVEKSLNHHSLLGFVVSGELRWDEHITNLKKELKQRMFLFRQMKQVLSLSDLKCIAEALFNSKIRYSIAAYGVVKLSEEESTPGFMKDLQIAQNSMMRLICGKRLTDRISISQLLESTNFLSVNQMAAQHVMSITWDIVKEDAIPEIKDKLILKQNKYGTRAHEREKLEVVQSKKEKYQSFINRCSKIWNEAPLTIKKCEKKGHFKTMVKKWVKSLPI